jgi:hypothetical protein
MAVSRNRRVLLAAATSLVLVAAVGVATYVMHPTSGSHHTSASGAKARVMCPKAPGSTATRAALERAENCADAAAVQQLLLATGADAANVAVSRTHSTSLAGPDAVKRVTAQVFLPKQLASTWNAAAVALAVSRSIDDVAVSQVVITDPSLRVIFDGSRPARPSARR